MPSATPAQRLRLPAALLTSLVACSAWGAELPDSNVDARHDRAVAQLREAQRAPSPGRAQAQRREALAVLDALLAEDLTVPQRRRAERDRLIALSQVGDHEAALAQFDSLFAAESTQPAYVLSAAGDSHAALRQPERALELYEAALTLDPDEDAAFAGRIFALADLNRSAEAEELLRDHIALHGRRVDRLRLAMLRAWSGWTRESAKEVAALAEAAPDDTELALQQGAIAMLRDRPQEAIAHFERALALEPGFVRAALSSVSALDRLGRGSEAEAILADLADESPDWAPLQRLQRERRLDQGAVLEGRVRAARGGVREIAAGEVRSEWMVTSPLLAGQWRAVAGHRRAYADFRGEPLEDERVFAGLRWLSGRLRLGLEIDDPRDRFVSERGYAVTADWRASDLWSFSASSSHAAFDLPLRARAAGTHGNRHSVALRRSVGDERWVRASAGITDYSDGNRRDEVYLSAFERRPLGHRLALTLSPGIGWGRNRTDEVPYFSPREDLSAELAVALEHRIQRRLARRHQQRFETFMGAYDQRGFDPEPIGGLRYEYSFDVAPGRVLYGRVGRDRRAYDGRAEYQTFAEIGLRFSW